MLGLESKALEEVGCVEGGVLGLEWSPDGEVLAAASGEGRLLIMTRVRVYALCMHYTSHRPHSQWVYERLPTFLCFYCWGPCNLPRGSACSPPAVRQ